MSGTGDLVHPPQPAPDGQLVRLGDGTFGVVALAPSADETTADVLLSVLAEDGELLVDADIIATVPIRKVPDDLRSVVAVVPAADGFVLSVWSDPDAPRTLRFDRAGAVVGGPYDVAGRVLAVDDTIWVGWVRPDGAVERAWVAAIDGDGGVTRGQLAAAADKLLAVAALFEVSAASATRGGWAPWRASAAPPVRSSTASRVSPAIHSIAI